VSDAATTSVSPLALARAAAQAALAVDGVADLQGGTVGEYATYGVGERQPGVRAVVGNRPRIGLRVVALYGRSLPDLVDEVRRRVRSAAVNLLGSAADPPIVDVHVADVVTEAPPTPSALPAAAAPAPTTTTGGTPATTISASDFS